jgi:hypothetical protein
MPQKLAGTPSITTPGVTAEFQPQARAHRRCVHR